MTSDIHAVVVRWRGGEEVATCLQALLELGGPRLRTVTLVDSGSGDRGAEDLAARFPSIGLEALDENRGFAHAANRGAAAERAPLLLLLNPDTRIQPGALDLLAQALDRKPGAAGVAPLLVSPSGSTQHRWQLRRLPTALRLAAGRGGAAAFAHVPATVTPVEQPAAAAWLVRRPVWDALGGLDPAFTPAWWEDVDFCARLAGALRDGALPAASGFIVEPRSRVAHAGGSSLADLGDAGFLAAYHSNLLRYAARHHGATFGPIRAGLRVSLALRILLRPARATAYRAALRALSER